MKNYSSTTRLTRLMLLMTLAPSLVQSATIAKKVLKLGGLTFLGAEIYKHRDTLQQDIQEFYANVTKAETIEEKFDVVTKTTGATLSALEDDFITFANQLLTWRVESKNKKSNGWHKLFCKELSEQLERAGSKTQNETSTTETEKVVTKIEVSTIETPSSPLTQTDHKNA